MTDRTTLGMFSPAIGIAVILLSFHVGFARQRQQQPNSEPVVRTTSKNRLYRARLRKAGRQPANLAGHYVLTTIGCGMECELYAAIDKTTGRVIWLPFYITEWVRLAEAISASRPIRFSPRNNRIVVVGTLIFDDKHIERGEQTWRLTGSRFVRARG